VPDAYETVVLGTAGLLYYWPLREAAASATVADIEGGNTGTPMGTVTLGNPGIARSTDTCATAATGGFSTTTSGTGLMYPLSLECWFKTSTPGVGLYSFGSPETGALSNDDRHVYIGTDGKVYFGIYSSATGVVIVNSPRAYDDGSWHHVVGVLTTTGAMELWVDGALVASNTNTQEPYSYASAWWRIMWGPGVGGWTNASTPGFTGSAAHFAVYNVALTPAQIINHYSGASVVYGGLTTDSAVQCRFRKAADGLMSDSTAQSKGPSRRPAVPSLMTSVTVPRATPPVVIKEMLTAGVERGPAWGLLVARGIGQLWPRGSGPV
jgi:hypothetical protein